MSRWLRATLVTAAVMLLLHLCAGPPAYWGEPVHGRVIDRDTGKAIAGAVVVGRWVPELLGGAMNQYPGAFEVAETRTGADGTYTLPGWGPRLRPVFYCFYFRDPMINVVKAGYLGESVDNRLYSGFLDGSNGYYASSRRSQWDGKTIAIGRAVEPWQYRNEMAVYRSITPPAAGLPLLSDECRKAAATIPPQIREDIDCSSLSRPGTLK
jgi:hypothetical protein